ncbi:hypothetical protein IU433_24915 [Nocardia puris]|uniref:ATP-binding cassette domain-containing protein n=1 Tax=Nocardia puris TaxID=208602 RepID=UPI001892FDF5|nr:ABC transporter ATP-binding protein [Nocardia puris]MBF6213376.1 hypothetical protein [Nocardia puris]MBF6369455.1 hypothetical protein [Nocardia puris]MBF6462256.1 hypothetical protein [Nocardia puris]
MRDIERRHGSWTVEQACAAAFYPAEARNLLPRHNSAGQIQRAALAAALLTAPTILVADSPTASLDQGTAYGVWKSLREYADSGAAVLTLTHDIPLLTTIGYADRLVIMSKGESSPTEPWRNSRRPRIRWCRCIFEVPERGRGDSRR